MKAELKVLGRLDVEIEFNVDRADPENGVFNNEIADWQITKIMGKSVKPVEARWLHDSINAVWLEESLICGELMGVFYDRLKSYEP